MQIRRLFRVVFFRYALVSYQVHDLAILLKPDGRLMRFLYLLFFVVFLAVGFVLAILNSAPIKLNYYYGWLEMPLSFLILGVLLVGIFLGIFARTWGNLRLRRKCSRLTREATIAKQEVSNLRTLPVKSPG